MIQIFECNRGIKIRLWINELPNSLIKRDHVIEKKSYSSYEKIFNIKKLGIEFCSPRHISNYGLLGAEILPIDESYQYAKVYFNDNTDELFADTMAYDKTTVHVGLLKEYAEPISQKIEEFTKVNSIRGNLIFGIGAHCEVGSSQAVFKMITEMILNLLILNKKEYVVSEIQKLLDNLYFFK